MRLLGLRAIGMRAALLWLLASGVAWAAQDAERLITAQHRLVAQRVEALLPHKAGAPGFYFLGLAGDGTQDVFMKEVHFAEALFDRRFGTRGRSLVLVNNRQTRGKEPLASVANLEQALDGIAEKMNREEDVLFLFLTSHGSPHRFALHLPPLPLSDLSDAALAGVLRRAGIRWRVIVISACYSGSFVEALKDENTLVITAAARDRTSFGCSSENDFTYFGDAYFHEALQHTHSFTAAFAEARQAIAARERAEELTPSEPQISVGAAIQARLDAIAARLDRDNAR